MKLLVLVLVLCSARNAPCQYMLSRKDNPWTTLHSDTACVNQGRDSLTVWLDEKPTIIPLDSVKYLTFREHKSWGPYLLAAGLVGASTYTALHLTGRDDAMYTAEGKARFVGVVSGGLVLLWSPLLKEANETRIFINPMLGINNTGTLISCQF